MAQFRPRLKAELEALDSGFSSLRAALLDLQKQSLANGGNPNIEQLKSLTREYTAIRNLLASTAKLEHTFSQEVPNDTGGTTLLVQSIKKLNLSGVSNPEILKYTNRLRGIFRYLVEEIHGYLK